MTLTNLSINLQCQGPFTLCKTIKRRQFNSRWCFHYFGSGSTYTCTYNNEYFFAIAEQIKYCFRLKHVKAKIYQRYGIE